MLRTLRETIERDILEHPHSNIPRAALADLLMESADPATIALGEFIAASLKMARGWADKATACSWGGTCGCDWHEGRRETLAWADRIGLGHVNVMQTADDYKYALASTAGLYYWRGLPALWLVPNLRVLHDRLATVFDKYPITRVLVSDRMPGSFSDHPAVWFRDMRDVLPDEAPHEPLSAYIPGHIFDDMDGEGLTDYFVIQKWGDK